MKRKFIYMALCLICLLCGTAASCHDEEMIESTLKFKNISSETVYVIMANAGAKSQDFHLPYSADQFDADEVAPGEDSLIDLCLGIKAGGRRLGLYAEAGYGDQGFLQLGLSYGL